MCINTCAIHSRHAAASFIDGRQTNVNGQIEGFLITHEPPKKPIDKVELLDCPWPGRQTRSIFGLPLAR